MEFLLHFSCVVLIQKPAFAYRSHILQLNIAGDCPLGAFRLSRLYFVSLFSFILFPMKLYHLRFVPFLHKKPPYIICKTVLSILINIFSLSMFMIVWLLYSLYTSLNPQYRILPSLVSKSYSSRSTIVNDQPFLFFCVVCVLL